MNVKIKARVAILKTYMTLLGFRDPQVSVSTRHHLGGSAPYAGAEVFELDRLDEVARRCKAVYSTEVVVTLKGHHEGVNNVLQASVAVPMVFIVDSPDDCIRNILRDAEQALHKAIYEKAKAKAMIPAADLL